MPHDTENLPLVIIHPSRAYADPNLMGESLAAKNVVILEAIGHAMRARISNDIFVCLVSDEDGTGEAVSLEGIHVVEGDTHAEQFLELKDLLIREGIEKILLAGFSRSVCILDVKGLLENGKSAEILEEEYQKAANTLGIERLDELLAQQIKVEIDDTLVDEE